MTLRRVLIDITLLRSWCVCYLYETSLLPVVVSNNKEMKCMNVCELLAFL